MTFKRIMSLIAMAFLWTGSQIPLYLFGSPRLRDKSLQGDLRAYQAVSHPTSIGILVVQIDGSGL